MLGHANTSTHIAEPPDRDWSTGPWEADCRTRLVRQRGPTDCGVACMAMATGTTYEAARAVFECIGLDRQQHPFSSNFKQLLRALHRQGHQAQMRRWGGWENLEGVGILKIKRREDGRFHDAHRLDDIPAEKTHREIWHWVVAERHPTLGYVLRDPAVPLAAFGMPPLDTPFWSGGERLVHGNWISVKTAQR